jgi:nucleotide-binding universal stress UspA family protein
MTALRQSVRRILVALEASRPSADAISTAIALAADLGAELEGLFVEDVQVIRAAGLPFATQVSLPSGARRPLDRHVVESELRAAAATLREALATAATARGVRWSFRVARGHVHRELVHASSRADVVVVAGSGRAVRAPRAPGVVVAYDGSEPSDRALDVALRLATDPRSVLLLVAARSAAEAGRLAERARASRGIPALQARWAGGASRHDLVRAIRDVSGPLIVAAEIVDFAQGGPELIVEVVASPLLILR